MKKQKFNLILPVLVLLIALASNSFAQSKNIEEFPYRTIPETPQEYTAGNVAARTLDGLGFRFYWATEGLTEKDYAYSPGTDVRNIAETIEHIYSLTNFILVSIGEIETLPKNQRTTSEKRIMALQNIETASKKLSKSNAEDLESYKISFSDGSELPFWYLLNGPIADAIWHSGQIASFRRLSGNPFNAKVSVLRGTVEEN